jgi:hypothetical protein
MRTGIPWALVLIAAASTASCSEPKCRGELSSDDTIKLHKLVMAGKDPCPEQLHPKIEASRRGVTLGGRLLMRDGLPEQRVVKLKPLFDELKQNRENWKMVHPGDEFVADPTLRIDPDSDAGLGASALSTTAYAGYPSIHLACGGLAFDLAYAVQGPPQPDQPASVELVIEWLGGGSYAARYVQGGAVLDRSDTPLAFDAVVSWAAAHCPDPRKGCARAIALSPRGTFLVAATLLDKLLKEPVIARHTPAVRFDG